MPLVRGSVATTAVSVSWSVIIPTWSKISSWTVWALTGAKTAEMTRGTRTARLAKRRIARRLM